MTTPIRSYHAGGREYKAQLMAVIGQMLDETPPDEWPPGPLVAHVVKKRAVESGMNMPRRVERCLKDLVADGYLAPPEDGCLRLRRPGINYLYTNGYLRRFFKRPAPADDPAQRVYAIEGEK